MTETSKRSWPFTVAACCVASLPWFFAWTEEPEPLQDLAERLAAMDIGFAVNGVARSEVPGLFELTTDVGVLYVTEDANYLISGNVYEIRDAGLVNLTEKKRAARRRELFASIDETDPISFTPEDGARASVLVFTDTDCGFCRRMHGQMPDYLANGIEVRYLAYPRAGVGSPTYDKMVSAWCADDAREALTALKRGEGIPQTYCENHPIGVHYELGQMAGIAGTPAIVLPDGRMLPGFVPPAELAAMLGL